MLECYAHPPLIVWNYCQRTLTMIPVRHPTSLNYDSIIAPVEPKNCHQTVMELLQIGYGHLLTGKLSNPKPSRLPVLYFPPRVHYIYIGRNRPAAKQFNHGTSQTHELRSKKIFKTKLLDRDAHFFRVPSFP